MLDSPKFNRRQFGLLGAAAVLSSSISLPASAAGNGTFVLGSNTEIDKMDPHVALGNIPTGFFINAYDSLVRVHGNPPTIKPSLAASWEVSPDGLTYTFKLQPKAVFHDGSPVNAEAVKYSFNRLVRIGKGVSWMIKDIVDEKSVEAIDATTVKITLRTPFAAFLQVVPWIFIVNPKVVEANLGADDGQTYLNANIAGSGPFKLTRFQAGTGYAFTRFADYWDGAGGNVQNVVWRIVRETATQRQLLDRGEVHFVLDLTADDFNQIKGHKGIVGIVAPTLQPFYIRMNSKHGPLADANIRRAVSYAFNYQGMLDVMGFADLMVGPLPTGVLDHDPDLPVYRTDLAKAKEALAASGQPDGGFKLVYTHVSGYDQQRKLGLVLLDALKPLKIDVEIKPMTWPDIVAAAKTPETQGDFMALYESANYADPDNFAFAAYHSSQNGTWSNPVYANPKVDELIMTGRHTVDPDARKAAYFELQKIIVEEAADIFGVQERRPIAYRDNVSGYDYTPIGTNVPEFFPLSVS
jgi:peptide/nickel transport system substrate-binding protein